MLRSPRLASSSIVELGRIIARAPMKHRCKGSTEGRHAGVAAVRKSWPVFALIVAIQIWATHAIAFFAHEYGHSFTAAALGWKADPFVLNFGDLSWSNLLAMFKIDERVDYAPIFKSGNGAQASRKLHKCARAIRWD